MSTNTKQRMTKFKILKNLGVISLSLALLFTAFDGLSALQSTMNDVIGATGQGMIYLMFCISTLCFSKYVIQKIGCKYSILVSEICYVPYIASNFYPDWITVAPTAMLTGLASATMWGGQCTYFNKASVFYCSLTDGKKPDSPQKDSTSNCEPKPDSPQKDSTSNCEPKPDSPQKDSTSNFEPRSCHSSEKITPSSPGAIVILKNDNKCAIDAISRVHRYDTELHEIVNALFFGWNAFFCKIAEVLSNLMSFFILKTGSQEAQNDLSCSCGARFCDSQCRAENLGVVSDESRYLLSGICVGLLVLGIVLLTFLDHIEERIGPVEISFDMLSATFRQLLRKEQICLTPLSLLTGLMEGFYIGDVTRAYVGCSLGTYHGGIVTICFGLFGAVSSTLAGLLVKHIGRVPVISFGILSLVGTCVLLLLWTPNASQPAVFFLISSLFGVSGGTLWSQTPAFCGVLFKDDEEAAFAGFYAWDSLGRSIPFLLSNYLCTYANIYILISMSVFALFGYLKVERAFALRKKESK